MSWVRVKVIQPVVDAFTHLQALKILEFHIFLEINVKHLNIVASQAWN